MAAKREPVPQHTATLPTAANWPPLSAQERKVAMQEFRRQNPQSPATVAYRKKNWPRG